MEYSIFRTHAGRALLSLLLLVTASSFTLESYSYAFSPVGTWEYAVPGVESGYQHGSMVIGKVDNAYTVTMILNEYSKTEAEDVLYKRRKLSFTIWVENEEISVTGTFQKDQFSGILSYSEGDFSITATRAASSE